jgi:hypothetical protein
VIIDDEPSVTAIPVLVGDKLDDLILPVTIERQTSV